MICAIPTEYAGVRFRSRLEAKWAAFFDIAGWKWEYEPIDLDGYIPDFLLRFPSGVIAVEVKPLMWADSDRTAIAAARRKMNAWENGEALLLGACIPMRRGWESTFESIGEIREGGGWWPRGDEWVSSFVFRCGACKCISIASAPGSWACRVNGCYDGDGFLDGIDGVFDGSTSPVEEMFRLAGNRVQWRAP